MPEQTVRETPDSSALPPFTETEAEAVLRELQRLEERELSSEELAEALFEYWNPNPPLWRSTDD